MISALKTILSYELKLAWRQGSTGGMAVAFFLVTVALFPLGVGPEAKTLASIGGGVIWVAALLAALLSLERLIHSDLEDGFLDQLALSPWPLELVIFAKALGHWLVTGLPLVLATPLLGVMMQMQAHSIEVMFYSMLVGTPALSFIGSLGSGLTAMVKKGGLLIALLILPLYIPTLIFGVSAIDAASFNGDPVPHLMILAALSIGAVALTPFASAAAIRLALE
ncbi:MAG: heme exporter protein CcmB [Sphingomonadales bacterium]|nr:heme exporter protein CcmB [Sphingomonadales bacterium]